jgi:hypothetical protein
MLVSEGAQLPMITGTVLGLYLLLQASTVSLQAETVEQSTIEDGSSIQSEALRAGRGGFRTPAGGSIGGNRSRVNPGYGKDRAPSRTGRFGGFFGGLAAGTFLSFLFNPFGFGGGGFSILGILFWGLIVYLAYRVVRRMIRGKS